MNLNNKKYSLILSKNFIPLSIKGIKKTMSYLINDRGKALDTATYEMFTFEQWIEKYHNKDPYSTIRTEHLWIMIPEIVVLNSEHNFHKIKRKTINRRKVYERDEHKCAYCTRTLNSSNRTIDHIYPISKGGSKTDYKNVVACCSECNRIKSNILLDQMIIKGPHLTDDSGNIIMKKEQRWKLKKPLVTPNYDMLLHIPKNKRQKSWSQFI